MFRNLTITFSVLFLFSFASLASAASVTYGPSSFGTFIAGAGGSFGLPQFDPSLGTLTQITLEITGNSFAGFNVVDNESDNAGFAIVKIGTDIQVTGPSSLVVLTTPFQQNSGPIAADNEGGPDFVGADSLSITGTFSTDTDSSNLTNPLFFTPYLGLGNVTFNYLSFINLATSVNVSPAPSDNGPSSFDFSAKITYEYNAIPEPSTVLFSCFAGFGAIAYGIRRRRAA